MAAAEPRQRHPPAGPQAEASDRLVGIAGACRQMPALEPDQRGEGVAIELDQSTREESRTAGDVGQNHLVGTSLVHGNSIPQPPPAFINLIVAMLQVIGAAANLGGSRRDFGLDPNLARL